MASIYSIPGLLLLSLVIRPSYAVYHQQPIVPKGRDYEAKVMIFHDNQPPLGSWNPRYGQPFPKPLDHSVTKQDIIDNISRGLLRRKLTPTEIEAEEAKVNEAGLEAIHKENNFHEEQRQNAHHLLEEMRRARADERKKQQEEQKKQQRQLQPKYPSQKRQQSKYPLQKRQQQPKFQPQKRQKQQQRVQPAGPMRGNRG